MALTRWDPFHTVTPLRDTIDRVFEDFFSRPRHYFLADGLNMLPIDMYETSDSLVVQAHLPGVEADKVSLNVERGTLTIQAHLPTEAEKEEAREYRWHHRQIWGGDVTRTIALPVMVDAE